MTNDATQAKKRLQRRLMIIGALSLGLFTTIRFGVLDKIELRRSLRVQSEELELKFGVAKQTVAEAPRFAAEAEAYGTELRVITNRFVLRQVLGSYAVQTDIHRLADEGSFRVVGIREIGSQATPRPPTDTKASRKGAPKPTRRAEEKGTANPEDIPPCFARYVVDVTGSGSFADVIDFVGRLERSNPYLGVLSLSIRGVAKSPERHQVSLKLEWPVDADQPGGRLK